MDINSKYYITRSCGGWSPCIQGNTRYGLRPFVGSVLPNCVGMLTGAFNEYGAFGECKYLGNANARDMIKLAVSQGLKIGTEPKEGAAIVWNTDYLGHCAFVQRVISSDDIITVESGWRYTQPPIVRTIQRRKSGSSWSYPGLDFMGFIYQPEEEEEDIMKTFKAYTSGEAVRDPEVLRLQILLNGLQGSRLSKDSYYGPATTKAVYKWQSDHGIKATGTCDQGTWNSILGK